MMDALQISTFGGLAIRQDDVPFNGVGSLRAEGLFIYLACTRQIHSRDSLVDLLWDELAPSQGLSNLRWLLALLRKQFAPYLRITRTTVGFDLESPHWLDVVALEQLLDVAEAATGAAATASAAQAVGLYKGPFLNGFYLREAARFEEWMLAEQGRLHRRVVAALQKLVASSLAAQDHAAGLGYARRLVQLEPLHEQGARQLMRLLMASGDSHAALEQFEQLRRGLDADIGVAPERATLELAAEIRSVARATPAAPLAAEPQPQPRHEALPHYFTPFVGRAEDQRLLAERLADPAVRLITVHGPGGSGKTRLAVEVARGAPGFADGVYFVPLEGVDRPDSIVPAIAEALDFPLQSTLDSTRQLITYLGNRSMLLVLDNFEQLLEAADKLLLLLGAAAGVKLLVTSQARLDLAAEVVISLEGLPTPPAGSDADAASYGAVQLFVERAQRVAARFALDDENGPWVSKITRLTEGLPLAIELAAARLRDESGSAIVEAIFNDMDRLASSRRDVPPRQRSLRAAFNHSCKQLSAEGRDNLAALGVFRGSFAPDAAAAVLQSDAAAARTILDDLVERSLLRRAQQDGYQMHGLLRGFALEMLPEAQERTVRERHARYYLAWAEAAARQMAGTAQVEGLALLAGDYDNIRAALDSAVAWRDPLALRFGVTLLEFWLTYGEWTTGREYLERALANTATGDAELHARAVLTLGRLLMAESEYPTATTHLRESLRLAAATAAPWSREVTAWSLRYLATVAIQSSAFADATQYSTRSLALFHELGDLAGQVSALWVLGLSQSNTGNYAAAGRTLAEGLELARRLGHPISIGNFLRNLGVLCLYGGQLEQAIALLQEALAIFEQVPHLANISDTQFYLGWAELGRDNGRAAAEWARRSLDLARQLSSRFLIAGATFLLGGAALIQGRLAEATGYAQEALAQHFEMNFEPFLSRGLEHLAAIAAAQGAADRATRLAAAADAWRDTRGDKLDPGYALMHARTLAAAQLQLGEAAFALAWAAGQGLTLAETVAEALAAPVGRVA